jgi:hypothetical protein
MASKRAGRRAAQIQLDEFTQLAFEAVLRATDARKLPPTKFPGPIIFGIIWWPEGVPSPGAGIGGPTVGR